MNLEEYRWIFRVAIYTMLMFSVFMSVNIYLLNRKQLERDKHAGHLKVTYTGKSVTRTICQDCDPEKAFYAGLKWEHERAEHVNGVNCDCAEKMLQWIRENDAAQDARVIGPFTWAGVKLKQLAIQIKQFTWATVRILKWPFQDMWPFSNPAPLRGQVVLDSTPARGETDPDLDAELLFLRHCPDTLDRLWIMDAERLTLYTDLNLIVAAAERRAMREYYSYYPRPPVVVQDLPD